MQIMCVILALLLKKSLKLPIKNPYGLLREL